MSKTKNDKKLNSKLVIAVVIIAVVILIAVLIFTKDGNGGNKAVAPGNEAQVATVEMNKDFSESFLVMDQASIADTKDDVINDLGKPESEREVDSLIPGVKAIELVYDGGDTVITIQNGRVEKIESTNSARTFTKGIKIGMSKSEVEGLMPEGSKIENKSVPEDSIVYSEVDSEEYAYAKYARFVIDGGKVSKIILSIGD